MNVFLLITECQNYLFECRHKWFLQVTILKHDPWSIFLCIFNKLNSFGTLTLTERDREEFILEVSLINEFEEKCCRIGTDCQYIDQWNLHINIIVKNVHSWYWRLDKELTKLFDDIRSHCLLNKFWSETLDKHQLIKRRHFRGEFTWTVMLKWIFLSCPFFPCAPVFSDMSCKSFKLTRWS